MTFLTDWVAREMATTKWALPECLHVPIAAVDESAIASYIGDIVAVLSSGAPRRALLVKAREPVPIDPLLPIWELEGSAVFHRPLQVWVHVGYGRYRHAYRKAFPHEAITNKVLSHAMNRRVAALKGFQYVRLTPVARASNSSSGFSEEWAVSLHSEEKQAKANARRGAFIQFADLTDLMLMLDLKLGGGVMDAINDGQRLVRPRVE